MFVTLESVNHSFFVPVMTQENTHTHMQTSVLGGKHTRVSELKTLNMFYLVIY